VIASATPVYSSGVVLVVAGRDTFDAQFKAQGDCRECQGPRVLRQLLRSLLWASGSNQEVRGDSERLLENACAIELHDGGLLPRWG